MRVLMTFNVIGIIIFALITSLSVSAENGSWYSRMGRALGLMDLTSSNSPVATMLNSLIAQKNPFSAFDIFLNQTRRIIPTIATFGNFTLLQAALVCAVGAMAAGAATFAAEAFYFKITNDQQHQQGGHQSHYLDQLPPIVYGSGNNHFRRNSVEFPASGETRYADSTRKSSSPYLQLERRYPTKSLKRTQRRYQRKNKNSGDQQQHRYVPS